MIASNAGRWLSPDPTRLSAFITDPQSWNRYSYAYNNPLKFVDRNGAWPAAIHNQIINTAFPKLSAHQRQILMDVSAKHDRETGLSRSLAYQHGMRGSGQSVAEAAAAFKDFKSWHADAAMQAQLNFWASGNGGFSDDALAEFGLILHALMDTTSPPHEGFQVWNPFFGYQHSVLEASITNQQLNRAASLAQRLFGNTFNPFDLLQQAADAEEDRNQTQTLEPTAVVTSRIIPCPGDPVCPKD